MRTENGNASERSFICFLPVQILDVAAERVRLSHLNHYFLIPFPTFAIVPLLSLRLAGAAESESQTVFLPARIRAPGADS